MKGRRMNNNLTKLVVILDASGSMWKVKSDTIGGFNKLIEDQKKLPGDCFVTVVQFSTFGKQKTIVDNKPLNEVFLLSDVTYQTGGWTAMRDAIGSTIDKVGKELTAINEIDRPGKVIVAIITDGEENDSREYSVEQIKTQITEQRDKYSWEFLFTAANQDAILAGKKLGISVDLSANYADTSKGTRQAFLGLSRATCALRCNDRAAAVSSMQGISTDG
jgi:uncharacterized protein YegL